MNGSCNSLSVTSNQCDLIIDVVIVSVSIQRFDLFRIKLGMVFVESLRPVLARFDLFIT